MRNGVWQPEHAALRYWMNTAADVLLAVGLAAFWAALAIIIIELV